jgi:large subunit ribosomal protein L32e
VPLYVLPAPPRSVRALLALYPPPLTASPRPARPARPARLVAAQNSWRKPKGIDNRARRRYKGNICLVKVGYGSNAKTRHVLPNGFLKFVVQNLKDLEMLLVQNRKYAAEIAHNVSAKTRTTIVKRAKELNIKLLNGRAKVAEEQAE